MPENVARVWLAGQRARTENVVERSVYRHGDSDSPLDDIVINPFAPREATPVTPVPEGAGALPPLPLDLKHWQLEQEKALIEAALQQGRFNQRKAAQLLGLTYHQLRGMLKSMRCCKTAKRTRNNRQKGSSRFSVNQ